MKIFFFIDGTKVNTEHERLTGAEIKQLGHQVDANIDASFELVLEGRNDPDRLIADDESVDLTHGHGEGPKHFSTRPRTNFGSL